MTQHGKREKQILFHQSSVKAMEDSALLTAPAGRGIWKSSAQGGWEVWMAGLPLKPHINRLSGAGERLFACTDKGLYQLKEETWSSMEMPAVCYEYKEMGGFGFAATEHGLWSRTVKGWKSTAFSQNAVYDFLVTPQFIFLAMDWGIAMYDRYTCTWEQFILETTIVRLAISGGALLGISEKGELIQGNKKGGFERYKFPGLFLFNAVFLENSLYLCADRGLYRVSTVRGQLSLISISLGCPVTDLDLQNGSLHMATLNEGIQTIQM